MRPHDRRCGHWPSMVTVTLRFQNLKRADHSRLDHVHPKLPPGSRLTWNDCRALTLVGVRAPLFRVEISRFSHPSVVHPISS